MISPQPREGTSTCLLLKAKECGIIGEVRVRAFDVVRLTVTDFLKGKEGLNEAIENLISWACNVAAPPLLLHLLSVKC